MNKKFLSIFLSILLLFMSFSPATFAQSYSRNINGEFGSIKLEVDGQLLKLEREPFFYQQTLYIPMKDFSKALSLKTDYDQKTKKLKITTPGNTTPNPSETNASILVQRDYQMNALNLQIKNYEKQLGILENNRIPYRKITSISEMQSYLRDRFSDLENISTTINLREYNGDYYRLYITFPYGDRSAFEKIKHHTIEGWIEDMGHAVQDLYDEDARLEGYIRDNRSSGYKTYLDFETKSSGMSFDFKTSQTSSSNTTDAKKLKDALYDKIRYYSNVRFSYEVAMDSKAIDLTLSFEDDRYYDWSTSKITDYLNQVRKEVEKLQGEKYVYGKIIDWDSDREVLHFRFEEGKVHLLEVQRPRQPEIPKPVAEASRVPLVSRSLTGWFNDIKIEVNQKAIPMEQEPFLYEEEIYAPIADFADALYLNYQYDETERKAILTTNGILRGETDQYLGGRIFQKNDLITKLSTTFETLKEQVQKMKKVPFPASGRITSVSRMESYLQDYFGDFEGIPMNITFSRYSGSEYRLRVSYDNKDWSDFDSIDSSVIESWVMDMFDAIKALYDPYAEINGSIRNNPYSSSQFTYITFETEDNSPVFDFEDHGTTKGKRVNGNQLEDTLNRKLWRYNSVGLSYEVIVNRKDVDLLVYFNQSQFYDWSLYRKMDFLQRLRQEVADFHDKINVNGKMIDTVKNEEVLGFSFENGYVRSLDLLNETETYLNKNYNKFTSGGNTFNFTYRLQEKSYDDYEIKLEGSFSKTDAKWKSVEENSMNNFQDFVKDALGYVQGLWSVNLSAEAYDESLTPLTSVSLYNTQVAAVNGDPASGSIAAGSTITLTTSTVGANIYYTLDESEPTSTSTRYTGPIAISGNAGDRVTLKAIGIKAGMDSSSIRTFTYTLLEESANLTGLTLSGSPSNFSFAPNTYNYDNITVANGVTSVTVTPTGTGTITVNGTALSSGQASSPIGLTAGVERTISIVHTETGKAPKTYTLKILRMTPSTPVDIQMTNLVFNTSILGVFSGKLTGLNDFTGYDVVLLSKAGDDPKEYGTVNVSANGTFELSDFDISVTAKIIGYRYRVYDTNGQLVREADL